MKKICALMLVLGLAVAAPLTSFATTATAAAAAQIRLAVSDARVTNIVGLGRGSSVWYRDGAVDVGFTFTRETLKGSEFTVVMPDEDYQALTLNKSFNVTITLSTKQQIKLTFTKVNSAKGQVLQTEGIELV